MLLPLFYEGRKLEKKSKYLLIPHYTNYNQFENENKISTFCDDWKEFVDRIVNSELVISSSLHGIIIAEAYGIPAIMLKNNKISNITKYKDWYGSTERENFPIAESVEEALRITPSKLDPEVLKKMQNNLLVTFPVDLWN